MDELTKAQKKAQEIVYRKINDVQNLLDSAKMDLFECLRDEE